MRPLRFVVWGAGFFGRKWAQEVLRREDCELAGVISRSAAGAGEARRALGLDRLVSFAAPAEAAGAAADAVIVALPQMRHREAVEQALGAGLHVLVEKPLAMDMSEARAIVAAARTRPDRVLMVSQNFRWRPHTRALALAVRGGAIGRVGHLSLECRQAIRRTTTEAWREQMADPYLADFAIHHFDLIRYVTGLEPEEVAARAFCPPGSWFTGRSAAAAVLTLSGGVVASYNGTMVASGMTTPAEGVITVFGETGVLHLDAQSRVTLYTAGEPKELPGAEVAGSDLAYGLGAFIDAVRTGTPPETNVDDNFRSLATLMAVMESAATRKTVRVESL